MNDEGLGHRDRPGPFLGQRTVRQLAFRPFDQWKAGHTAEDATATWEHIARSPSCSIAKAERLIGYRPRYTSFAAVEEAVAWLIADGQVEAGGVPSRRSMA